MIREKWIRNLMILVLFFSVMNFSSQAFCRNVSPYDARKANGDSIFERSDKGSHPEIDKAMAHLKEARKSLANAAGEYDGHRTGAINAIDQAMDQLYLALDFEKNRINEK